MNNPGLTHPRWTDLLTWLGAHGMDTSPDAVLVEPRMIRGVGYGLFAVKSIKPVTPLFAVPASALINVVTLSPHYPRATRHLTAFQLISLHLFLHRPIDFQDSLDPLFGSYISVLPREFDSHPLTWLCTKKQNKVEAHLLASLPPSTMYGLSKLYDRFQTDWRAVQAYLKERSFALPRSVDREAISVSLANQNSKATLDYLWAWLNVNTRCVYHRLRQSPSDPSNFTLCPILDFANHTTRPKRMLPDPSDPHLWTAPLRRAKGELTLLSPTENTTEPDEELYLTYGAHANRTLFVEYGFVNDISENILMRGDICGEIDLQPPVESLFESRGELGIWMKEILKDEGYWGDWTAHFAPSPAHPSYRLITALRLFHLFPMSMTRVPSNSHDTLKPWKATLVGERESVSADNEDMWKTTLLQICQVEVIKATRAMARNSGHSFDLDLQALWFPQMERTIKMLWEEELYVASAVAESVRNNEVF